ncbi:hypothetical protein YC2023_087279 [Brassica napus]|uniref:Uncharacterized protein n=2 Tax=Brassica oleracea TaxID=3712 RepID=A0A0D3DFJ7_BRAOL|nr:unnamed protein product [Brassica oleracea]
MESAAPPPFFSNATLDVRRDHIIDLGSKCIIFIIYFVGFYFVMWLVFLEWVTNNDVNREDRRLRDIELGSLPAGETIQEISDDD